MKDEKGFIKNLRIRATSTTPLVEFNTNGQLSIKGTSISEETINFYQPIEEWIAEFIKNPPRKTTLNVYLLKFNTCTSSPCLMNIFKSIELIKKKGFEVSVNWHYEKDNPSIMEAGQDYESIIKLDFAFIEEGTKMKTIVLSGIYIIVLTIMMLVTDLLLGLAMNHLLFDILNWFNRLNLFTKIVVFLVGGFILFKIIAYIIAAITSFLNALILHRFPSNKFTFVSSIILFLLNILLSIKILWDSVHFSFWTTIEFIFLVLLVISINWVFIGIQNVNKKNQGTSQKKNYRRRYIVGGTDII